MVNAKRLTRGTAVLMAATLALALCALCTALAPQKAWAADIEQTGATANSITVKWVDPNEGSSDDTTTSYSICWGTDSRSLGPDVQLGADARSYTIANLEPSTKYYVEVNYVYTHKGYKTESVRERTLYLFDAATRVVTPTGVKQDGWWSFSKGSSADFIWNVQKTADKVEWKVCRASNGKVFKTGFAKYATSRFSVDKLNDKVMYTAQIRVHDKWGWSGWSSKAYLFGQPDLVKKKTKVKKNKLTVTWNKISGATGYDVYVSTNSKKGYKKVKSVSAKKNTVTISKLGKAKIKSKKNYYVYVIAKKKVGKVTYKSDRKYYWWVRG